MKLTPRQNKFVAEYLIDQNGTAAARRAGYTGSDAVLANQASLNMRKGEVKRCIDEALQRRAERVEVKADDVLRELLRLAKVDIGQAFTADGRLKPIHEIPEDARRAISGIEVEEMSSGAPGVVRKIKFWDKHSALVTLAKHLGLLVERHEHKIDSATLEQLLGERDK